MSKQHYIPATLIGNFSNKEKGPRRERPIWVNRRQSKRPFITIPEKVGYKHGMYKLNNGENPNLVDNSWYSVESGLHIAINALIKSRYTSLDARMWIIIVQFIGHLFVRGFEFKQRFEERMLKIIDLDQLNIDKDDNTNWARLIELQKIMAPIMFTEWLVFHNKSNIPIIENDLGYILFQDKLDSNKLGYAIPLNKSAILLVAGGSRREIVDLPLKRERNSCIYYGIRHKNLNGREVGELNRIIAMHCIEEIYGASSESVSYNIKELSFRDKIGFGPHLLTVDMDRSYLNDHMEDFYKVLSLIYGAYD